LLIQGRKKNGFPSLNGVVNFRESVHGLDILEARRHPGHICTSAIGETAGSVYHARLFLYLYLTCFELDRLGMLLSLLFSDLKTPKVMWR
jgi:hypothetical protein